MKHTLCIFIILLFSAFTNAQITLQHKQSDRIVVFSNSKLKLTLNYNKKCVIEEMEINGEKVLSNESGIYSGIKLNTEVHSTQQLSTSPTVNIGKNKVVVSNIIYGKSDNPIAECWTFDVSNTDIKLEIDRKIKIPLLVEEVCFPAVTFKKFSTWDGAFLEFGGLAWFYLFNMVPSSYAVHSKSSTLWNQHTGNGLTVSVSSTQNQIVSKFSRLKSDELEYAFTVSDNDVKYRYDENTNRRRF